MSEPEPGNRNVNTVYFVHQARGNARISRTKFSLRNERARDCKCLLSYIWASFFNRMLVKIYFYKLAFALKHYKSMWQYLAQDLKADVNSFSPAY